MNILDYPDLIQEIINNLSIKNIKNLRFINKFISDIIIKQLASSYYFNQNIFNSSYQIKFKKIVVNDQNTI